MRILCIDPGTTDSAYVVWDTDKGITGFGWVPNRELLDMIRQQKPTMFKSAKKCVIEMVACYGMPVGADTFDTVRWIGRFEEAWSQITATDAEMIKRPEVGLELCNSRRAKDPHVAQALRDRFGEKGTKKAPGFFYGVSGHVWQAFAVGVAWADIQRIAAWEPAREARQAAERSA